MTARIDTYVQSAAPTAAPVAPVRAANTNAHPTLTPQEQAARALARERRAQAITGRQDLWKEISSSGGIDSWVRSKLASQGLGNLGDAPASASAKAGFKAKKQAESEARRKYRAQAWLAYHATHVTHLGAGIYWSDDKSPDAFDHADRAGQLRARDLPDLVDADSLAQKLGLNISQLRWLAYHREVDAGTHYRRWSIPKRDGGLRTITAPKKLLKTAQRWALRNVAEKLPVHGAAHGFLADRSIVTNAAVHAGADTIVKVDIKDFFPTVTWRRVKGLLRKAGFPEQVATLLALISTEAPRDAVQFRGKTWFVATGPRALPQGAPTSPAYSNALCMKLDRRMSGLARVLGFKYTRYADDLAFSWRKPEKSAEGVHPKAPVGVLLRGVRDILRGEGFAMHPDKTRVMHAGGKQRITGMVVNKAPDGAPSARVPRETVRRLKAALHNREVGKPGKEGESLAQLEGMAAFVFMADPAKGRAFLDRVAKLKAKENAAG